MNKNRFFHVLVIGLLFLLTACQAAGQPLRASFSQPVNESNGFSLETGAAEASPLWAFCSTAENTQVRTFQCRAPAWQTLAIGHLFLLTDTALLNAPEADLTWELSIDDTLVDLDSFGTFDYVMPAMSASPSPIREVFAKMTDWNLVMTNLNPGDHILFFRARDGAGYYYEWLVYLVIEGADNADFSAAPFPLHS